MPPWFASRTSLRRCSLLDVGFPLAASAALKRTPAARACAYNYGPGLAVLRASCCTQRVLRFNIITRQPRGAHITAQRSYVVRFRRRSSSVFRAAATGRACDGNGNAAWRREHIARAALNFAANSDCYSHAVTPTKTLVVVALARRRQPHYNASSQGVSRNSARAPRGATLAAQQHHLLPRGARYRLMGEWLQVVGVFAFKRKAGATVVISGKRFLTFCLPWHPATTKH